MTLAVAVLCLQTQSAVAGLLPGPASIGGNDTAEWAELYVRWIFGEIEIEEDENGNAVAHPNVVLMPLPNAPGDGTPASLEVDLEVGQAWVLPLRVRLGTSTEDETDELLDPELFAALDLCLTIDGEKVLDSETDDLLEYYTEFFFEPPISLNDLEIIYLQGIVVEHTPMSKGEHVIELDVVNTEPWPNGDGIFEYHNTWYVTVEAKD